MKKLFGFLLAVFVLPSLCFAQILPGNVSDSYTSLLNGGGTLSNSISMSHTSIGDGIVVGCSNDDYPAQVFNDPNTGLSSASVNGIALTQAWVQAIPNMSGLPITTEFYGLGLPTGPVTVTVKTFGSATNGHGTACFVLDIIGAGAVDSVQSQTVVENPAHPTSNTATCSYWTSATEGGDVAVMFFYSTNYGGVPGPTIKASPVQPSPTEMTGQWASPQSAIAFSGPIPPSTTFSETWNISGGNTSAAISVGAVIFVPTGPALVVPPTSSPIPTSPILSVSVTAPLSWALVSGATSYNVYRAVSGTASFSKVATGLTSTLFTDKITQGESFVYQVTAVNAAGESAPSNTLSVSVN
jgi:hypothetical protein